MTPGMVQQLPAWGPLAALMALAVVALSGAMINGVLAARSAGRRGGGLAPIAEAARLLRQRRRSTVAADELLRRVAWPG